jgi:hypothetical protein
MKNSFNLFFALSVFVVGILVFSSCSKMPVYKSNSIAGPVNDEFAVIQKMDYDKNAGVNYGVSNDDKNLYLKASFNDAMSFRKILRGGLYVYFDPEGKKKKHYKLKIERPKNQKSGSMSKQESRQMTPGSYKNNLPLLISNTLTQVTWSKNGEKQIFNRRLEKETVFVDLLAENGNDLVLKIKIPLKDIGLEDGQNIFSVGIESGNISTGATGGGRPGGGMRGGKGGGGGGGRGGGGGGQGGGGGRGPGMQGGGRSGGGTPSGMEPLHLWFQVELLQQ